MIVEHLIDFNRENRIGISETIFCENKSTSQINNICKDLDINKTTFFTRLKVDKYKKINVNTSIGDAAFIQMDLIHKSGFNSSNTVRYTAQIRFTNIEKDDYSPPQLIPKYLQYKR